MYSKNFFYLLETLLNKFKEQIACLEINIEMRIESFKLEFEKFENQFNEKIKRIERLILENKIIPTFNSCEFHKKISSIWIGHLDTEKIHFLKA